MACSSRSSAKQEQCLNIADLILEASLELSSNGGVALIQAPVDDVLCVSAESFDLCLSSLHRINHNTIRDPCGSLTPTPLPYHVHTLLCLARRTRLASPFLAQLITQEEHNPERALPHQQERNNRRRIDSRSPRVWIPGKYQEYP